MGVSIKEFKYTYGKLTKLLYVNERQKYDEAILDAIKEWMMNNNVR